MGISKFVRTICCLLMASVVLSCVLNRALAATFDTVADHVIGQSTFTGQGAAATATGLNLPFKITIDRRTGRVWVGDYSNNRVLSYPSTAAMANGQAADFVLGQPNLTSNTANNGGLSASSLVLPAGIAVDAAGNVFVADSQNNRVLMYKQPLTTDAVADVVFGQANFTSGASGTTAATLFDPTGVALDQNGNLFVADFANNRVLRYTPPFTTGMDATLVLGQSDFVTHTGGTTSTTLSAPEDMTLDSNNNLYVADRDNNRVLEYDAGFGTHAAATRVYGQAGVFTTNTLNNGGLGASSLNGPSGVSVDPFNNLYIVDLTNNRVVEYNSGNPAAASRVFGQPVFTSLTPNNGGIGASTLNSPFGCVSDNAGNLLIADGGNNRVLEYDLPISVPAPTLTTTFPTVMYAGSGSFTLYVTGSNFINTSVVNVNGLPRATTFTGFNTLTAVIPASDVAVALPTEITVSAPTASGISTPFNFGIYNRNPNDTLADRVIGQPDFITATANTGGASARVLNFSYNLFIDKTGRLWVADFSNNRILSWVSADAMSDGKDADFVLAQPDFTSTNTGTSATTLKGPGGILVDVAGNVFVADTNNNRVLIFNDPLHTDATADVVLGQANFVSGNANQGGVSAATLAAPFGLALDGNGSLYVADYINARVLRYAPPFVTNMNAIQVFGQPNLTSNTPNNGGVSASSLGGPGYVTLDAAGNLYISDFNDSRVLEYNTPTTTDNIADKVFGQPNFTTATGNTGGVSAQSMFNPDGMALDAAGNLYVADLGNNRVLVFNSPLTSNGTANRVFGQGGSFTTNTQNTGGIGTGSLFSPVGVAFDAKQNLYICDRGNNRILSYDHPLQNPPVISSAATATPSTVLIGQPVTFTAAATDPDGDTLAYTWDFGDSTTGAGASVSHAYQVAGVLNVILTITDGFGGTATSTISVTVMAPPPPPPPPPPPVVIPPNPLGDVKLTAKLNFAKPNADKVTASGTLELPAGSLNGTTATVQVANLNETFMLVTPSAKNSDGKFSVTSKGTAARAAKFKLSLSKKTFAAGLALAGLVNMTTSTQVHVPVTITLNGNAYQATVTLNYSAKAGVSGSAK